MENIKVYEMNISGMDCVSCTGKIGAADVALMRDDWSQIPEAIKIGRSLV